MLAFFTTSWSLELFLTNRLIFAGSDEEPVSMCLNCSLMHSCLNLASSSVYSLFLVTIANLASNCSFGASVGMAWFPRKYFGGVELSCIPNCPWCPTIHVDLSVVNWDRISHFLLSTTCRWSIELKLIVSGGNFNACKMG